MTVLCLTGRSYSSDLNVCQVPGPGERPGSGRLSHHPWSHPCSLGPRPGRLPPAQGLSSQSPSEPCTSSKISLSAGPWDPLNLYSCFRPSLQGSSSIHFPKHNRLVIWKNLIQLRSFKYLNILIMTTYNWGLILSWDTGSVASVVVFRLVDTYHSACPFWLTEPCWICWLLPLI